VIARKFSPPTFEVEATDEEGRKEKWVTGGDSEEAVTQRLESDGWTVHSATPYDFSQWLDRSVELLDKVEAARDRSEKPDFDSSHWGQLKRHLFELFGGKCAYCEAIARHVSSGDVEHYRPKARVQGEPDHPGYYWLAYQVENLLPACELCNRAGGKMNRFPVEDGTRAVDPTGLETERPLLLNPYLDDSPRTHLRFLKTGHVEGRTEKGRQSISVYRLGRLELRRAREKSIEVVEKDLEIEWLRLGIETAVANLLTELRTGKPEYSAALFSFLTDWLSEQQSRIAAIKEDLQDDDR
jgi:uncharacterized protein (TIGR02646 family)